MIHNHQFFLVSIALVTVTFFHPKCQVSAFQNAPLEQRKSSFGLPSSFPIMSTPNNQNDPFADFDPRISPHSYDQKQTNHPSTGTGSMDITKNFSSPPSSNPPPPTPATSNRSSAEESITTTPSPKSTKKKKDPFAEFDPRVSPHMYPNGIETTTSSSNDQTTSNAPNPIGILLIDHGSRKAASNELLETIASIYQTSSKCPSHFVVKAAHMEIASPSIEDVLTEFVMHQNIKQVICHPYFLSPGRHVTEDIPELVQDAKQKLLQMTGWKEQELQIITTPHTGSRLNVMIDSISHIVEDSIKSELRDSGKSGNGGKDELGGFFGDVMRMMEEQTASEQV